MNTVGRDRELASIASFLEAEQTGARILPFGGEAGIGKTTLWRAGVDAARELDFHVLASAGAEAEAQLSFTAVRGSVVTRNGSSWVNTAYACCGGEPGVSGDWNPLAAKGDQGPAGPDKQFTDRNTFYSATVHGSAQVTFANGEGAATADRTRSWLAGGTRIRATPSWSSPTRVRGETDGMSARLVRTGTRSPPTSFALSLICRSQCSRRHVRLKGRLPTPFPPLGRF